MSGSNQFHPDRRHRRWNSDQEEHPFVSWLFAMQSWDERDRRIKSGQCSHELQHMYVLQYIACTYNHATLASCWVNWLHVRQRHHPFRRLPALSRGSAGAGQKLSRLKDSQRERRWRLCMRACVSVRFRRQTKGDVVSNHRIVTTFSLSLMPQPRAEALIGIHQPSEHQTCRPVS